MEYLHDFVEDTVPEEIDEFVTEDGKHVVKWTILPSTGYSGWFCTTHEQPYYVYCVMQD